MAGPTACCIARRPAHPCRGCRRRRNAEETGADPIEMTATAECSGLVKRGAEGRGRLLLGMTRCQAGMRL